MVLKKELQMIKLLEILKAESKDPTLPVPKIPEHQSMVLKKEPQMMILLKILTVGMKDSMMLD